MIRGGQLRGPSLSHKKKNESTPGVEYCTCTSIYLTDLKVLTIGHTTVDCGETNGVTIGDTYFVEGDGQSPGVNCTYTFTSELDASCQGLCYNMTNDSFFRDELATLTITSGSYSKVRRVTNYVIC